MGPITVLNQGNVPVGPFTRTQIADKLRSGEFSLDNLAFVEGAGMSQWTPLRDVLAKVDGLPPTPAPGASLPPAAPAYSYAVTMEPPTHLIYAGFWIRFVAYLIDSLIIGAAIFIAAFFVSMFFMLIASLMGANFNQQLGASGITSGGQPFNASGQGPNVAAVVMIILMEFFIWGGTLTLFWLYFAKLESGPSQATYGKRVLGLRVTDMQGQRIGFGRATGRTFGKIVSAMPFDIGFIMAAFTDRKQALHDMIAGTLVVRN